MTQMHGDENGRDGTLASSPAGPAASSLPIRQTLEFRW